MHIVRLSQDTINKIAAGEVVQRPSNAVKELIENSVDAGATSICITIVEGGLKELTVADNGKGIAKEDFPLVCQRFATSKIRSYEDLQTIDSFGFRGEALASLSYVSDVTVVSKEKSAEVAYSAEFSQGKMLGRPDPHHLSCGTVITARNMFGNTLLCRKESLRPAEQRRRIIKVVSQFAVHYSRVKFRVLSDGKVQLATEPTSGSLAGSRLVVFSQLFEHRPDDVFEAERQFDSSTSVAGIFTKPKTATAKSKSLLLMVNNRIVELPEVFSAVQEGYVNCYKSIHVEDIAYTVYLSLSIDPRMIDCNVHPTKKVVHIVNSSHLCDKISKWVLDILKAQCRIISFYDQQPMPPRIVVDMADKTKRVLADPSKLASKIRTDSREIPITYYLPPPKQEPSQEKQAPANQPLPPREEHPFLKKKSHPTSQQPPQQQVAAESNMESIRLKCQVEQTSPDVKEFFRSISYVGCVNSNFILVQHGETLKLLNLLPFMPALLIAWLKKEPSLYMLDLDPSPELADLFQAFSSKSGLSFDREAYTATLISHRSVVWDNLRVRITQTGKVTRACVPLRTMEGMRESELGYLMARTAKHLQQLPGSEPPDQRMLHLFLVEYLSSLFEEPFTSYQVSSAREYDSWYRDRLIPLAKIKGEFPAIDISSSSMDMLHLKQVYKVFQRC